MKYIRTKNKWLDDFEGSEIVKEVYQIYDVKKGDDMNLWAFTFEGFPYCITEEMIIKQADTIEELCDEFRGIWINYWESMREDAHEEYHYDKERDVFYDDFEELTHEEAIEKFDIFYGAIWTDKGLIYVAKMNESGCLELL